MLAIVSQVGRKSLMERLLIGKSSGCIKRDSQFGVVKIRIAKFMVEWINWLKSNMNLYNKVES